MTSIFSANRIRDLNDAMRRAGPGSGRWMMTEGVQDFGPEFFLLAMKAVQQFSEFSSDNDSYGEHDFGAFNLAGEHLFWKIDYYDHSLSAGSGDPSNEAETTRVLTIMLASEY
jgi:hypothetical protein